MSGAGSRTAGPDDRAIDAPEVVIDVALIVQLIQQGGNQTHPSTVSTPTVEELDNCLPGPVTFWEVAPGGAGMQDPKDAVDQRSGIVEGVAGSMVVSAVGQQGGDPCPLLVREFVAVHGWVPEGDQPIRPVLLSLIIRDQTTVGVAS